LEATVIDIRQRLARTQSVTEPANAPDLVRRTRQQLGMSEDQLAGVLATKVGWDVWPGHVKAWESGTVEVLDEVIRACHELAADRREAATEPSLAIGGSLVIPCWIEGRIRWVSVNRRTFLAHGGKVSLAMIAAAALPPPPGSSGVSLLGRVSAAGDCTPVEHLAALRRVLIESDNQLGSASVLPVVENQVKVIRQLVQDCRGADRRALLTLQAQYAEFAGWLRQDGRDFSHAQYWLDRALEWSHMADDQEMATYVIVRKSQLAGDMGNADDAADLAEAAAQMAIPRSRIGATAACFGAHGYALAGQQAAAERAIGRALDLASDVDDGSPWAVWLVEGYIRVQQARCLGSLGQHHEAAEVFGDAIGGLPSSFRRDCGVYLGRQALEYARAGDPEHAAATGMRALDVAGDAQSRRVTGELGDVGAALARWQRLPDVARFRDALADVIPA
jgi:tetratricopeptide (TPR) repeat protein